MKVPLKVPVRNADGKTVGTHEVRVSSETHRVLPQTIYQAAAAQDAHRRVPRAHTKNRAERRGGGRKPWRQKGTGRARVGSTRSPLWRKGGVVFGPRSNRAYAARVPAGMRRAALAGVLAGKIRDKELVLLDVLPTVSGRTREMREALSRLPVRAGVLLLVPGAPGERSAFSRASRNLPRVRVADPSSVPVSALLRSTTIVTTPDGLRALERRAAARAGREG